MENHEWEIMTQTELDALPVYGGGDPWPKPLGAIIIRVRYCFQWCKKCGRPINGEEGVIFRDRGELIWMCDHAYHLKCMTDVPPAI